MPKYEKIVVNKGMDVDRTTVIFKVYELCFLEKASYFFLKLKYLI